MEGAGKKFVVPTLATHKIMAASDAA